MLAVELTPCHCRSMQAWIVRLILEGAKRSIVHDPVPDLHWLCRAANGSYLPGQPPVYAPAHLQPIYPHQMAAASYPLHPPQTYAHAQPQALPGSWQPRPPVTGSSSAPAQFTHATGGHAYPPERLCLDALHSGMSEGSRIPLTLLSC